MMQPVVQEFDVQQFDIHEDRSITMAINTKKKPEVANVRTLPDDKENANQVTIPVAATQQASIFCFFFTND